MHCFGPAGGARRRQGLGQGPRCRQGRRERRRPGIVKGGRGGPGWRGRRATCGGQVGQGRWQGRQERQGRQGRRPLGRRRASGGAGGGGGCGGRGAHARDVAGRSGRLPCIRQRGRRLQQPGRGGAAARCGPQALWQGQERRSGCGRCGGGQAGPGGSQAARSAQALCSQAAQRLCPRGRRQQRRWASCSAVESIRACWSMVACALPASDVRQSSNKPAPANPCIDLDAQPPCPPIS